MAKGTRGGGKRAGGAITDADLKGISTRWTKGDMDRSYLTSRTIRQIFDMEDAKGDKYGDYINSKQKRYLKIYYDHKDKDWVVQGTGSGGEQGMREAVKKLIKDNRKYRK